MTGLPKKENNLSSLTKSSRIIVSKEYSLLYNIEKNEGVRIGKTREEAPLFCPFGPESITLDITKNHFGIGFQHLDIQRFEKILESLNNPALCWVTLVSEGETNPLIEKFVERLIEEKVSPNLVIERSRVKEVLKVEGLRYLGVVLDEISSAAEKELLEEVEGTSLPTPTIHLKDKRIDCSDCQATLFSLHVEMSGSIYPCRYAVSRVRRGPSVFDGKVEDLWFSDMAQSFRKVRLETPKDKCPIFPGETIEQENS